MAITLNGGTGVITGVSVGGLPDGVVDAGTLATNSVDSDELINGAIDAGHLASGVGGKIVQVVNVINSAVATGTTTNTLDDTIPQKTEGNEVMTLAITPTNSSNKLIIYSEGFFTHTAGGAWANVALFQDTTANALSATTAGRLSLGDEGLHFSLTHYMTAGTTSSTTFKIRAGGQDAGTMTFNGSGGTRYMGGVMASSITITEIAV